MKTTTSVIRNGHSLVVVIPSDLIHKWGIRQGDKAGVQIDYAKGQVTYLFVNNRQLPLV